MVLVQPSFYRTDNSCMLDAMAHIEDSRGVAVLPPQVTDDELDDLDDQGVRGLRVNIATLGLGPIDAMRRDIEAAARLCERHGWHVQIFVPPEAIEPLTPTLLALPVATVIDHFGLIAPGPENGALRALLKLLEVGANLGEDFRRLSHRQGSQRSGHRAAGAQALRCQSGTHRLGFGLAAYADARHPQAQQYRGIAVPEN